MQDEAARLVDALAARNGRVVFAESCTAGLVASELAKIPGVSQWLCGSAVTYREATKIAWLGVTAATLEKHSAVSAETSCEMAVGVLSRTEEATFAAAVTGHLGPDAPPELDGVIFIAIAYREQEQLVGLPAVRHVLQEKSRVARQQEAAKRVHHELLQLLQRKTGSG